MRTGGQRPRAVGARHPAGKTNGLALDHILIFLNVNFRYMAVNRGQPVAVDEHNITVCAVMAVLGPRHVSGSSRADGRPLPRPDVYGRMFENSPERIIRIVKISGNSIFRHRPDQTVIVELERTAVQLSHLGPDQLLHAGDIRGGLFLLSFCLGQ